MREDEPLSAYLTRLFELINEMKSMGAQIKNSEGELSKNRIVQKLLISLTKTYDPVCTVIEQTKDLDAIEVQEVVATLKMFEQMLERHSENTVEKAFASMSVKEASSSSSLGSGQSKKNWKTNGKKWEDKPNLGGK
ncbi:hypothetical protein L3X38_001514 [Prunus dulcis]|uniref:Gag-pol polyprotein n=1 Tax=Prunus dulcis TaxID=3755 RepID=A0AAD4WU82_PRUDU|nr:hypothetical protein L3X38_001514 [Prunus dulcis]